MTLYSSSETMNSAWTNVVESKVTSGVEATGKVLLFKL